MIPLYGSTMVTYGGFCDRAACSRVLDAGEVDEIDGTLAGRDKELSPFASSVPLAQDEPRDDEPRSTNSASASSYSLPASYTNHRRS